MYECPSEQGRGLRLCWCTSQVAPIHGARDAPSATTSVDPTSVTHVWEAAMKDDEEVARQKHLIALLKHLRADHQLGPAAVYQCVVVLWALARAREDLSRLVPFAEVEDQDSGHRDGSGVAVRRLTCMNTVGTVRFATHSLL